MLKVDSKTDLKITLIVLTNTNAVATKMFALSKFLSIVVKTFVNSVLIVKVVLFFSALVGGDVVLLVVNVVVKCVASSTVSLLGFFSATRKIRSCVV